MKKYIHKSGKYRAIQNLYKTSYEVSAIYDNKEGPIGRILYDCPNDIIEKSNDWVEMIEVPVSDYYSKKEIYEALEKAEANVGNNIARYGLTLPSWRLLQVFKQNFYSFLKNK